ncbi:MAG: glycosyltransferase family 4 protein [Candidatus Bathyarchaeia archaeon]
MRVLHLSWEFPPRIIGGIAAHVFDLSRALVRKWMEVHVVTCNFPGAREYENIDGVNVHRFEAYAAGDSFYSWALRMQKTMERKACDLINFIGGIDIIHAHDWLSGVAGIGLKHLYRKPLIVTIHSTEYGRRIGIRNDLQQSIHEVEGWLCYEAWRIITCSYYMRDHVSWCFRVPSSKLCVVPNGVDVTKFWFNFNFWDVKRRFAHDSEKILLYVGRLVPEKGLDILIKALPIVLSKGIPAKIVVVGDGPQRDEYQQLADNLGLHDKVFFAGHVDDWTLRALYRVADVTVVPSRFEPFGIVALEAMAAHCPLVVTACGGLNEIVDHEGTGLKVPMNNPEALAWAITRVVTDRGFRDWIVHNAYQKCLWNYNWDKIAEWTSGVYNAVLHEYNVNSWKPT